MRSNLLTRKLRPSEVKPWVMQMMDSRGLTGTQAPSLATELVLFTTSLYFLRTKANWSSDSGGLWAVAPPVHGMSATLKRQQCTHSFSLHF